MFDDIEKQLEEALTNALDKAVGDGTKQYIMGVAMKTIGEVLAAAGEQLAGARNEDGDA